jgi:hypothetical protein
VRSRRVLVFGSSQTQYTDTDESGTAPAMMRRFLAQAVPETEWQVETVVLYPTSSMTSRASKAIDNFQPDVLLYVPGSNTFSEETVAFSIRKKAPRLDGPAMRVIGLGKSAAGGKAQGSESTRGLLFRLPRDLARKVIGVAPLIEPDEAFTSTRQFFASLAKRPGLPVACRLAMGHHQQSDQSQVVRERTRLYNELLIEECERLGYPYIHIQEEFAARGWVYTLGPDRLHEEYQTRQLAATIWGELVLSALARR